MNFIKKHILSVLILGTLISYFLYSEKGGPKIADFISPEDTDSFPFAPPIMLKPESAYKDGVYTGDNADAYYGNMQVSIVIQNGKLIDIKTLDHPKSRITSVRINNNALPILKSEAIKSQSAKISAVSGASYSSRAYKASLASALSLAMN